MPSSHHFQPAYSTTLFHTNFSWFKPLVLFRAVVSSRAMVQLQAVRRLGESRVLLFVHDFGSKHRRVSAGVKAFFLRSNIAACGAPLPQFLDRK
ncbi:hypothetical protein BDN72DRAFT_124619 [Pluteus cervinus]|uniref:Uncharacterized protein n=1 Tax=Pluteus cervinus TaxID=181527 RepID=A0ACD3AP30_9AGAR|nr:hypothetical protein BDN72DRAFT_124619 [Pluteus cervinus]